MEKTYLPSKLWPQELERRIGKKIAKMPSLDTGKDGAAVIGREFFLKSVKEGEAAYKFVVKVFGPKTVEAAERLDAVNGMTHVNVDTFSIETKISLRDVHDAESVRWLVRHVVDDCVGFYAEVRSGFAGENNISLDALLSRGPHGERGCGNGCCGPKEHLDRVTQEEIDRLMAGATFDSFKVHGNTTVVTARFESGWTMTEQSACIDPANYDHALGVEICKERIEDRLWELEGYRKVCARKEA